MMYETIVYQSSVLRGCGMLADSFKADGPFTLKGQVLFPLYKYKIPKYAR